MLCFQQPLDIICLHIEDISYWMPFAWGMPRLKCLSAKELLHVIWNGLIYKVWVTNVFQCDNISRYKHKWSRNVANAVFFCCLICMFIINDLIPCNCMWIYAFLKLNNFMMNETKNSQHFYYPNCCLQWLKKNLYFVPRINSLLFLKADFYPVYSAGNLYTFYCSLNELPGAFLVLSKLEFSKSKCNENIITSKENLWWIFWTY